VCFYKKLPCDECGTNVDMKFTTNEYPDYFSWQIESVDNNRIIMSSDAILAASREYVESKCLSFGDYILLVTYDKNDTQNDNVTYSFEAGGITIFDGSTNGFYESEKFFTICKSNSSCVDYDGCTSDVCNAASRLCENEILKTQCNSCSNVSVELIVDNYPEETRWELTVFDNGLNYETTIISGNPYLN